MENKQITYKDAGVDIDKGNEAVKKIQPFVEATYRKEVLSHLGGFGGLFALDTTKYKEPVLVSGTDGVGTKLKLAFMTDKHDTIGIDAVAMCVNDILVSGAEPLFFLDYVAVGNLGPEKLADIVQGVAEGCKQSGCSLVGGETAEMPGFYGDGEYDIAGFAVGIVNKDDIIDGSTIKKGDVVIGIPSNGLHSNGYSLARKLIFEVEGLKVSDYVEELGSTVGEALIKPTIIYVPGILPLIQKEDKVVKGMAHITGGGLSENIPRILPKGLGVNLNKNSWDVPPIFSLLQRIGHMDDIECNRTFNMGIGFTVIVDKKNADEVCESLRESGFLARPIGVVKQGEGVTFDAE